MTPRRPTTVVIARFEDLVARGLRCFVAEDDHLVLAADDVTPETLGAVLDRLRPSVAVVNFAALRSASDVHTLAVAHPATRLIVLGNRPSPGDCSQMLAFGATACLSKDTQARDIVGAIHLASRGLHVLPRTAASGPGRMESVPGPDLLTAREVEVLDLLRDNRSNAEIALALHVGIETIRTHRRNIYRKLGVRTRRELAAMTTGAAG